MSRGGSTCRWCSFITAFVAASVFRSAIAAPAGATADGSADGPQPDVSGCSRNAASELFNEGMSRAAQADHEAALKAFHAAYQCKPHFATLYNISQANAALGRFDSAIEALQRYALEAGDRISDEERMRVRQQVEALRVALDEAQPKEPRREAKAPAERFIEVDVQCDIPGTKLLAGQAELAEFPFPRRVKVPGETDALRFVKYGFVDQRITPPAEGQSLNCQLSPADAAGLSTGSLEVTGGVASVEIDGVQWPDLKSVPVGVHLVRAQSPSGEKFEGLVTVSENRRARWILPQREVAPLVVPQTAHDGLPTSSVVLGSVSLLAGGAAIGLSAWNHQRYADWKTTDDDLQAARRRRLSTQDAAAFHDLQEENNERLASVRTVGATSIGLGIVAVGALVTAFYIAVSSDDELQIGVAAHGVNVRGRW